MPHSRAFTALLAPPSASTTAASPAFSVKAGR